MAVANLGQWLSTVVQEVISSQEEMEEMSHVDIHNITGIGGVEDHTEHHGKKMKFYNPFQWFLKASLFTLMYKVFVLYAFLLRNCS